MRPWLIKEELMMLPGQYDFTIGNLGTRKIRSSVGVSYYTPDDKRMLFNTYLKHFEDFRSKDGTPLSLEVAGPREFIFFEPSKTKAAIVTCGGLCPGLNDVIRAIVMALWYGYGVRRISGIRYGYRGFLPEFELEPMALNPDVVEDIHQHGGTILGSSRGYGERADPIVDTIQRMGVNVLFTIGGDGTQKGALGISRRIRDRGLKIAVVGVPKTIDNDLSFVERSFGFDTAVQVAVVAVAGAHNEARGAWNGISIVRLMGRQSGFIAAHTALSNNDVNYCLVPEVPFDLDGDKGLLLHLENRLRTRRHAVIVAAEGAGQEQIGQVGGVDASGNPILGDVGLFLKERISAFFKARRTEVNVRYIDPSYVIRSAPANANDSVYCMRLGTHAVHAAMAGRTEMIVSLLNGRFVHVPIRQAVARRNVISPEGSLWRDVLAATGQPAVMKN